MPRLSLAQTLPPELLTRIFGWLTELQADIHPRGRYDRETIAWSVTSAIAELREAALVCRQWRAPAQRQLFRSINLDYDNAALLQDCYEDRPDLADATQAAVFELRKDSSDTWDSLNAERRLQLSTLALCKNIRHLAIGLVTRSARDALVALLDCAPLESLVLLERGWSHLEVEQLACLSPFEFCAVAQKSSLRYFQLQLRPRLSSFNSPFVPLPNLASPITTLAITMNIDTCLARLVTMAAASLRKLAVYSETPLSHDNFGFLLPTLPVLQEMRIYMNPVNFARVDDAWIADVLPKLTSLEKLFVTDSIARPSIVLSLPPHLKLIEYSWSGQDMIPVIHTFAEVVVNVAARLPSCTIRFSVDPDEWYDDSRDALDELEETCLRLGVNVDINRGAYYFDIPEKTCISFFWRALPCHNHVCVDH
ncbi:hypothetical protein JCM10049v2_007694 [Rhodotorula toruloides]